MFQSTRRWLPLSTLFMLGLMLAVTLLLPSAVSSAPSPQSEVITMTSGETRTLELNVYSLSEIFDSRIFTLNTPVGATVYMSVKEVENACCSGWLTGGCNNVVRLKQPSGTEVDTYSEGVPHGEWSPEVSGYMETGTATLGVYRSSCLTEPSYPYTILLYLRVEGGEVPTVPPPPPSPEIDFWADQTIIRRGECTTLHWRTNNVQGVYYQGQGVGGNEDRVECPTVTTTYELRVVTGSGEEIRTVYIVVEEVTEEPPTWTPVPPPTWTPQPAATSTPVPYRSPTPRPPAATPTPRACPDYYEGNDYSRQAILIEERYIELISYICTADDVDWFAVYLEEGQDLEVILTELPGDYDLELWDGSGQDLLTGSYRGGRQDDNVWWSDAEEGIYLIRVESADGDFSAEMPYILVISITEGATPAPDRTPMPSSTPTPEAPWVLVVTHEGRLDNAVGAGSWTTIEGWLEDRYGNIDVLDLDAEGVWQTHPASIDQEIEARFRTYADPPEYILIIGGPSVIRFGEASNPMNDGDVVYTDDLYADFNGDWIPDVPTARLPDGGDFEIYNVQFSLDEGRTASRWGSGMAVAQPFRPYAAETAALIGAQVQWSPPVDVNSVRQMGQGNAYFMLHGMDWDSSYWTGEADIECPVLPATRRPDPACLTAKYLNAFDTGEAMGQLGTVVSGACYGAFLGTATSPVARADSVSLTFLRNATEAFVGHTATTYSVRGRLEIWNCIPFTDICWVGGFNDEWPVNEGPAFIEWSTFNYIRSGLPPLLAYHRAKLDLAGSLGPTQRIREYEEKALHSFVFYGLPPSR